MRGGAVLETVLGFVVLVTAGVFLIFAQGRTTDTPGRGEGYELTARFAAVGDLSRGAEVRVAGVPVGAVQAVRLDPQTYFAETELLIRTDIRIPADSTAKITSAGLLGGTYVSIEPGGDDVMLTEGEEIEFTQGAIDLFDLIAEFASNRGS